jgi:hypothetical protein
MTGAPTRIAMSITYRFGVKRLRQKVHQKRHQHSHVLDAVNRINECKLRR